jgi:cellulose synthase/poly-beta-1,6-N-acetylglucosamine synthase-like glycosyltransferase
VTALALLAAALALAGWVRLAWLARVDRRALLPLPPAPADGLPTVTAVVPCRNEAAAVERAMRSVLAQDLPGLRVVAVDDRSGDGTGEILDRLAAADARLEVLHVRALPDGWLGKNHACHAGAARAAGEWILFTDGDVVLAPDALSRALAAARAHGLGHASSSAPSSPRSSPCSRRSSGCASSAGRARAPTSAWGRSTSSGAPTTSGRAGTRACRSRSWTT